MDKLTTAMMQHAQISESTTFFKAYLETFKDVHVPYYLDKMSLFIDEYVISHFEFEEKEVFGTVLERGSRLEKHLIRELQMEHTWLLDKLDGLRDALKHMRTAGDGDAAYTRKTLRGIMQSLVELNEEVIIHAHKEDEQLFPLLRKLNLGIEGFAHSRAMKNSKD